MTGTPETFSIKSEELGRTRRIAVTGELDLMTCMRLRGCFDRVLPSTAKAIEVDLSAVTFIDSGGVHLLSYMRARAGGRLRVIPGPAVARLIRLVSREPSRQRSPPAVIVTAASLERAAASLGALPACGDGTPRRRPFAVDDS